MDLKRDVDSKKIDELIEGSDYFPFVETWSNLKAEDMFLALVESDYGGKVEGMPKVRIDFSRTDFSFAIPDRFRFPYEALTVHSYPPKRALPPTGPAYVLLTHDLDNKDYRSMNAVGEFYMEDLRLSSSRRRFMDFTPIEMWDRSKKRIVEIARQKSGPDAGAYEIRNAVFAFTKESNPFRPTIALAVYSIFNATSILDMSAGWGDRLIGALAWARRSGLPIRYQGYDPFSKLQPRYEAMIGDFADKDSGSRFEVTCSPFEDAPIEEFTFNLAFTSPPYFDFEKYGVSAEDDGTETQSASRYPELQVWIDRFLKPMMVRAAKSLRLGGHLALNIEGPFVYKLLDKCMSDPDLFGKVPMAADDRKWSPARPVSMDNIPPLRMEYHGIIGYRSDDPQDTRTHPIFVWRRVMGYAKPPIGYRGMPDIE